MDSKWFVKSKTVIGIVIAALPTMLPLIGVAFSADDTHLVNQFVDGAFQLFGLGFAIYGRFVSTQPITLRR